MEQNPVKQINPHVWLLRDGQNNTCYLVCGNRKALLIDSMIGHVNVREMAEEITSLPITVANTHGHGDHIRGNLLFDSLRQGLWDIVNGKTEQDPEYKWFGGTARRHPFADGSVIVYADNIG